jgi:hypothetical protein
VAIYRIPGVYDDGGGNDTGRAMSFLCSSFSGVEEIIRFVVRNEGGTIKADQKGTILSRCARGGQRMRAVIPSFDRI